MGIVLFSNTGFSGQIAATLRVAPVELVRGEPMVELPAQECVLPDSQMRCRFLGVYKTPAQETSKCFTIL